MQIQPIFRWITRWHQVNLVQLPQFLQLLQFLQTRCVPSLLVVVSFGLGFTAQGQPNRESLVLAPGISAEVPAPPGVSIRVGNGRVLRATDLGSRVRLTGRAKGQSRVQIGRETIDVSVVSAATHRNHTTLSTLLQGRKGLSLQVEGDEITVRGRLLRLQDWLDLAGANGVQFRFSAQPDPSLKETVDNHFQNLLRSQALSFPGLVFAKGARLTIAEEQKNLIPDYERLLSPYGIRVEPGAAFVALQPLIRVKITVAEVRRNLGRQFGVQWPEAVKAQLLPENNGPVGVGGLEVALQALETQGLAKVLASPSLLCRSGKEAEFLAGGEFPIKIANFKNQDVIWKRYGVLLKIQPTADRSGAMSIGLATEVSMLDGSRMVDGLPGLLTNRIESHFDLRQSRTIVLSGLIKKEWSRSSQGLPGLNSLPVLGTLFGSRSFLNNETEMIVFVTPEVVMEGEDHGA